MSRQHSSHSSTAQMVEPGRIPNPPVTWYPLGSVPLASTSMSLEGSSSSQDGGVVQERRPRGPSCPVGPWGPDGGKLQIIMNKMGQPIMDAHSVLATCLGVLARDGMLAPLHYYDWRYVPEHCKTRIWNEIKGNTNADESMKSFLMKSVAKKWRDWKHDAKEKGYNKYTTDNDRLAHRPSRVHEDQWRCLAYYWGSREAQDLSDKNFQIQKKQTLVHTTGRTPHCVIKEREKKKRKASPSRIEMFITTHTKDGKPINVAAGEIMEKLSELKATREESTTSPIATDDQIFTEVLGSERPGRIRGCGMGPTPSQVLGGKQTTIQVNPCGQCGEELRYLKDRMKIMEAALSAMGITLPVPQDQPTDVGSAHNEIHSHHDSHSDHEIGISPQPHLQQQPSPHHGVVRVSRSDHTDHEENGPSLDPQPQPSPHREVDGVTSSIPHHSSCEANMDTIMRTRELPETRMMQTLREELACAKRRAEEERAAHNATKMASVQREVEL